MNISKMKRSTQIAILAGAGSTTEEKTVSGTTPLTLSDSVADNIHSINVKGHSEVVSGEIKSIGDAGWGVVDLGTLTYTKLESGTAYAFRSLIDNSKTYNTAGNSDIICSKFPFGYATTSQSTLVQQMPDKTFGVLNDAETHFVYFKDTTYTDATAFKSAMSGVLLYYPLADTTGATSILGITSKNGAGQGTAATITTGLPLRSVSDSIYDTMDNEKVVKKCGSVKGSDLTWDRYSFSGTYVFYATVNDAIPKSSTCLNNTYTTNNTVSDVSKLADKECTMHMSNNVLYVRDDTYTDVQTFTTAVADVEFLYELATPTETPLTSAEKSALAQLRTYDSTTNIDATDNPSITVKYMGKNIARTAPKKRSSRKKKA